MMESMLETDVAWTLKNSEECPTEAKAKLFFSNWCKVVDKSRLKPMIKAKGLLKHHINNILNYFKHLITNAVSEGLNSKIQMLKASARGFHLRKLPGKNTVLLWEAGYANRFSAVVLKKLPIKFLKEPKNF